MRVLRPAIRFGPVSYTPRRRRTADCNICLVFVLFVKWRHINTRVWLFNDNKHRTHTYRACRCCSDSRCSWCNSSRIRRHIFYKHNNYHSSIALKQTTTRLRVTLTPSIRDRRRTPAASRRRSILCRCVVESCVMDNDKTNRKTKA